MTTRPWLVVAVLGALGSAGCPWQSSALGLEGTYRGVQVVDVEGTERSFTAVGTLEQDYDARTDAVTTYTVEPGLDSDAVVHGARCPVSLKVFGEKLVLESAVECDAVTDRTTHTLTGDRREQTFAYQTIRSLEIERAADDRIRLYMDAELKTIVQLDDEPSTEDERREKTTFEGTRIADEKS